MHEVLSIRHVTYTVKQLGLQCKYFFFTIVCMCNIYYHYVNLIDTLLNM